MRSFAKDFFYGQFNVSAKNIVTLDSNSSNHKRESGRNCDLHQLCCYSRLLWQKGAAETACVRVKTEAPPSVQPCRLD
jgi:CRISPR/Cas system-associated protein endoribonuclease Cas2